MLYTLARLEETGLSSWLRESGAAFFSSLILHSLSMALVVGINIALALRLLNWLPAFELAPMQRFFPLHWTAAALILGSGLALLLAYPAKALTNPVFYIKLLALGAALFISRRLQRRLARGQAPGRPRLVATAMLVLWIVVIVAGRFLAYTNSILLASRYY